jgi:hypothetical protein
MLECRNVKEGVRADNNSGPSGSGVKLGLYIRCFGFIFKPISSLLLSLQTNLSSARFISSPMFTNLSMNNFYRLDSPLLSNKLKTKA